MSLPGDFIARSTMHHATTASTWISDHLQTDSRKFTEAAIEFAGRLIEVRHDSDRRCYEWLLDGRVVSREAVERALDMALVG
ncbi:hypothetical protein ADM96_15695 [Burkholderia sp. ST111]|nr:hypothetical protein ADM96_15695 [Burkholderia sp. ST111]